MAFNKNKNKRGFTLIEALTVLFIFSLITVTFYSVFSVGLRYINDSKNRLGALAIANEKMEIIRNLSYEDIGTDSGDVEGDIPTEEDVSENSRSFHVETDVQYIDDDFDSTAYNGDVAWEDYKKVTVIVSWNEGIGEKNVKLTSRFVPPGLEVANPGDGILLVNVFSDQPGGAGIPSSSVHIYNPDTGLNITRSTDNDGNVFFMGDNVQDSIQKYELTITKSGYETVSTMDPYPSSPYNPVYVHASVVTGSLNVYNIVQNEFASLKVKTVDYLDQPIQDIDFHFVGGKLLGYGASSPLPIYNLEGDYSTDSNGEKDFGSVSPGTYTFTLDSSETNYEIIDYSENNPLSLFSSQNIESKVKLAAKNATSVLIKILNDSDGLPISGAEVKLSNASGYDITRTSNEEGIVFFPTTSDVFSSGTYDLNVTSESYSDYSGQVIVIENELKTEEVRLNNL